MGFIDDIISANKNISEAEIEENIRKEFKMRGYVLADVQVIKSMDNKIELSGKSDIIPVTLLKNGDIRKDWSKTLTKEEFNGLQKNVRKIIKEISTKILMGNIDIKPYKYNKNTGCDFCKYKTICNFNTKIKGNEFDYIKNNF